MEAFAHFSPAEKHHSYKCGFHEECQNPFNCQRCSENVTNKPRIITPVCTEFKFQNQTGRYTNSEVDTEKLHPELSSLFPEFISCFIIQRLHDSHHHCQSKCKRNKNPMIHSCHRKLGSRPIDQRGVNTFNHNLMLFKG